MTNQIRGLLGEYGIIVPQGLVAICKQLPEVIGDQDNELTPMIREVFRELYEHLIEKNECILKIDVKISQLCKQCEICQRLLKIEGIGPLSATALVATVGDAKVFKNGRHMAAWLGLVPRQASSGGKQVLLGISKRGDCYLRSLLIHGGRAVVRVASKKKDPRSIWIKKVSERRNKYKAYVALANKNARIAWALMAQGTEYKPAI